MLLIQLNNSFDELSLKRGWRQNINCGKIFHDEEKLISLGHDMVK